MDKHLPKQTVPPQPAAPEEGVVLKKIHLVVVIVAAVIASVIVPTVSITLAYSKARADVYDKVNEIQLQNMQTFAKASDLKDLTSRLDKIQVDLAEIKGYLLVKKTTHGDSQ